MRSGLPAWARVSDARRAHVERVAALTETWATAMHVSPAECERWMRAAFLHDALRDAEPELLAELAPEWSHVPKLRHGPAAAVLAERDGERDRGILEAVRFHSIGYADWDAAGRMLYLADYLEPGRPARRAEHQALAARVPGEPEVILREVARERLAWAVERGRPILPQTIRFWNAIVSDPS